MPTASTQIEELLIPVTSTTPLAGFAELYERHYEAVFRAALRVTGRPADAEDVLQTVFLRVPGARVETSRTLRSRPPTSGAPPSTRPSTCCAGGSFMRSRRTTIWRRTPPCSPRFC